jgi:hypothetical protein
MEILPLLKSKCLPNDIILHNVYDKLCRIKIINKEMKDAIINDHYRFKKILLMYYNNTSNFSRNKKNDDYFLIWLENDLVGILNDDYSLCDGLTENLKKEWPTLTKDYLLDGDIDHIHEKVYELWKNMTPYKRTIMYERTMLV